MDRALTSVPNSRAGLFTRVGRMGAMYVGMAPAGLGREVMIAWEAPQTDQYLFHTVVSTGAPVLYGLTECDGEELGCGNEFLGVDNQAGFSAEVLEGQQSCWWLMTFRPMMP